MPGAQRSQCYFRLLWLVTLLSMLGGLPGSAAADDTLPHKAMTLWLDPAAGSLRGELVLTPGTAGRSEPTKLLNGLDITHDEHDGERRTLQWQGRLGPDVQQRGLRLDEAGSFLPAGGSWYPALLDEPFSLSLTVELPPGQRSVATGSVVASHDDDDRWREHYHHPRSASIEVAAGPWELRELALGKQEPGEQEADGIILRTLFPASLDAAFADTYLTHAARYLELFQARLGRFPFASFTIAATPEPVGLAFPGFTLLGERVIPLPFIPHTSLAHEIMHAWWGTGVRLDHWQGNWSEALTTYLADYYLDELRGDGRATRTRWLTDLSALPVQQERALIDFHGGADPAGRLIGYQHGAMVFHMLRQQIGDAAFDQALRTLAETAMFQRADWSDLQHAFEASAETSLGEFFTAWVTQPGRPLITLEDGQRRRHGDGWMIDATLQQQGENGPWPIALPLSIETSTGVEQRVVTLEQPRQRLQLTVGERPLTLEVDPELNILRKLNAPPATLRELLLSTDVRVLVVTPGLESLAYQLVGQLPGAGDNATALTAANAPLQLVIGLTDDANTWLDDHTTTAVPDAAITTQGSARMWHQAEQPLVVISADNPRGLGQLASALRHMGQYSYVVQDAEGTTLDSGRWHEERRLLWYFEGHFEEHLEESNR